MFFPPSPYPFSNFLVVSILQWFTGKENPYKTLIFFTKDRKEARIEKNLSFLPFYRKYYAFFEEKSPFYLIIGQKFHLRNTF